MIWTPAGKLLSLLLKRVWRINCSERRIIYNDMMKKIFAAAVLLGTMTACGGSQQKALPLEGTQWKLARMEAIPAKAVAAEADFFTLEFNAADTMVAGRTNCNRFFGKYELKGQKLSFGNLGMTRMACPDMQYEDAFVKMLDEVDSYAIEGSELKFYDDKKVVADFGRPFPYALDAVLIRSAEIRLHTICLRLSCRTPRFRLRERRACGPCPCLRFRRHCAPFRADER